MKLQELFRQNKGKIGPGAVLAFSFLLGAIAGGLQWYYFTNSYDRAYQMYVQGANSYTVLSILCAVVVVGLLASCFLGKDCFSHKPATERVVGRSLDWLCAVASIFLPVGLFFARGAETALCVWCVLLCVPCAIFFAWPKGDAQSPKQLIVGWSLQFCLPVFLMVRLFFLYFDMSLPVFSPLRIWELLCVMSLTLVALAELRSDLGMECNRFRWICIGFATVCTAISALPQLLQYAIDGSGNDVYLLFALWEAVLLLRYFLGALDTFVPKKWEQMASYLLFGILTTAVDFAVYALLTRTLGLGALFSNLFAWIVSVGFAYVVNKFLVFDARCCAAGTLLREIGIFVGARVLSFVLSEGILWLGVYVLGIYDLLCKVVAAVFVIVLNYIASKWLIFRKENKKILS